MKRKTVYSWSVVYVWKVSTWETGAEDLKKGIIDFYLDPTSKNQSLDLNLGGIAL